MKKILILLFIISPFTSSFGQKMLLSNEECIFSFKTKKGKTVMLAKDKDNGYIIYRFGNDDKIELEFPSKITDSWKEFKYNYYFRGGGKQNAGIDIDNLKFSNKDFEYVIYMTYDAGDDDREESVVVGVNVHNLKTGKVTEIKGDADSITNSLQGFRTNGLLEIDLEMGLE